MNLVVSDRYSSTEPWKVIPAIASVGAGASGASSGSKAQSLANVLWQSLSANVYVFLHNARLSDVVERTLAPCPAVPALFSVVDDDTV